MAKVIICSTEYDSMMFSCPWLIIEHADKLVAQIQSDLVWIDLDFNVVMGDLIEANGGWGDEDVPIYVERVRALLPEGYTAEVVAVVEYGNSEWGKKEG